jgi:hypothetical protein
MIYVRLFVLAALFVGVWAVTKPTVKAAPSCAEYYACLGDAEGRYLNCMDLCAGIIACENVCQGKYNDDQAYCETTYPC